MELEIAAVARRVERIDRTAVRAIVGTCAANRHRQIVPCRMISNVSHASVSRLVADRGICLDTASDKAFENNGCTARSFVARQRIASVNHLSALFNCVQYDRETTILTQFFLSRHNDHAHLPLGAKRRRSDSESDQVQRLVMPRFEQ